MPPWIGACVGRAVSSLIFPARPLQLSARVLAYARAGTGHRASPQVCGVPLFIGQCNVRDSGRRGGLVVSMIVHGEGSAGKGRLHANGKVSMRQARFQKRAVERWPAGCVVVPARCECPNCSRWAAVHRFNGRVYCENCCPEHGGKVQVAGQTAEDISATGA
jgi:hypothetical protein